MRGFEKKIYYVKNTGSLYFEEAYLVLKNVQPASKKESNLAEEAQRIIREASANPRIRHQQKKLTPTVSFLMGSAAASLLIGGVTAIIALI